MTTASLRSELASAELGFQDWGTVFNPTRRRFERQLVINWRTAVFDLVRVIVGLEKGYCSDRAVGNMRLKLTHSPAGMP